jgi:hypothetical protein
MTTQLSKRLMELALIMDDCGLLKSKSGDAQRVMREAATALSEGALDINKECESSYGILEPLSPEELARMLAGRVDRAITGEPVAPIPEGFSVVLVKNFGDLMDALDRADRKGYMPDALAEEWAAFDWRAEPIEPSSPERQPAAETAPSRPELSRILVRAILENATAFEWSLQGMGMLRLHLSDNTRLHVWDSRYRVPNVSMIHDHLQWGLESTIVAGRLRNHRYIEDVRGEPYKFATLKPGYGCFFKHEPVDASLIALAPDLYEAGQSYSQEPSEIHETDALDGTVTLMRKTPTDDESARVFWATGDEWVSAEPRAATDEEVRSITSFALSEWFGGAVLKSSGEQS